MSLPSNKSSPQPEKKAPREHPSNPRSLEVIAKFVRRGLSKPQTTTKENVDCRGICSYLGPCQVPCNHGQIPLQRGGTYTCPYFCGVEEISYKQ